MLLFLVSNFRRLNGCNYNQRATAARELIIVEFLVASFHPESRKGPARRNESNINKIRPS